MVYMELHKESDIKLEMLYNKVYLLLLYNLYIREYILKYLGLLFQILFILC